MTILELNLSQVDQWLAKETESSVNSLNDQAKKLLEDLKSRVDELFDATEKLLDDAEKEMARGSNKTFRRAKFLFKLAGSFSDLLDKIVIPEEFKGETLGKLSENLTKAMDTINQEKTKWFRALAPYFILSRRRFDATFKRAEDPYHSFIKFFSDDYTKVIQIESVPSKIAHLLDDSTELNNYEAAKQSRIDQNERLNRQIEQNQLKLKELQNQSELCELAQLNLKIDELTKVVKYEFRHLEKPLLKYQTLVNNPGYSLSPEANSKLDAYQNNPFEALATEKSGCPLLKSILQKVDDAITKKKMKLKPSRLRKAQDQIDRIMNKNVLSNLQTESQKYFNQKQDLLSSGAISECKDEKTELLDWLKNLQTKKQLLEAKDHRLDKENNEAKKRAIENKKELETMLSTITGITVSIVFD